MSVSQILFFNKNAADYSDQNVVITASQGASSAAFVQRRSNAIGWMTTGSIDADNTTLTCDFVNMKTLTDVILVGHTFKDYTVKYWDGSQYQDFSTPIAVTSSTDTTTRHAFNPVNTTRLLLTVTKTQNEAEKKLNQFIATSLIGQLNAWPVIKNPTFDLNKRINTMLSGKTNVGINLGGFSCDLTVSILSNSSDLSIIETLYGSGNGFLVWLCGGNQTQFSSVRQGYRLQDIFLMQCRDNLKPEWAGGQYKSGMVFKMSLTEVTG